MINLWSKLIKNRTTTKVENGLEETTEQNKIEPLHKKSFIPENRLPKSIEDLEVVVINCGYSEEYKNFLVINRKWIQKYNM